MNGQHFGFVKNVEKQHLSVKPEHKDVANE